MKPENVDTAEWPYLLRASAFQLRTPFIVIRGYVRMLEAAKLGPLTEQQRAVLHEVQEAVRRAEEVLKRMDALEAFESGGARLDASPVRLCELIQEVVAHVRHPAWDRLEFEAWSERDTVIGDGAALKQAFTAIFQVLYLQHTPKGPVAVRLVERAAEAGVERWIVIAPADQIEHAVNVSSQNTARFDERQGPLSIDLAYARRIVTAHGGKVYSLRQPMSGAAVVLPAP